VKPTVTAGLAVLAGVALFEAALIPGVVIGGAAVLAPKYLPKLRRGLGPLFGLATACLMANPPGAAASALTACRLGGGAFGLGGRGPPSEAGVPVRLPLLSDATASQTGRSELTISRALAKTITFRTIATAMDFTATYVVVGDLATAAGLSAFAFVVGPFVYLGHEKLWDYYSSPRDRTLDLPAATNLLPAPR
jgi:uncharacterized membrane protein